MVTGRRAAATLALAAVLVLVLFTVAVRFAPERERAYRTAHGRAALVPAAMMETSPEAEVRATLYFEKRAALSGDVAAALRLWEPDGVIRDANFTPDDAADDRVWAGADQLRRRYADEFARHRYLSLSHTDASVLIEGGRAVVVNDLVAEIETPTGRQRVFLARSDRWTLERSLNEWRIRELVVNRAPR
jgi:hypothetical protein